MRPVHARIWTIAAGALALLAANASAAILRVERNGTGEFTTLQAAVDAASPGDVLLIGPGRYDDIHTVQFGTELSEVLVDVHVGNLTFRGTDRNAVVLGPAEPAPFLVRWWGLIAPHDLGSLTVENLTVENLYYGVGLVGTDLTVRDCTLRQGDDGINTACRGVTTVERSTFMDWGSHGIAVSDVYGSQATHISDCEFIRGGYGVDSQTVGTIVNNCRFRECSVGLQLSFAAMGTVDRCILQAIRRVGIGVIDGSTCSLTDCTVESAEENMVVENYSHVTGTGNIFPGGSYATMTFDGQGTATLHACHILQGSGPRVRTGSTGPAYVIDLTNNYWGTTDVQQIAGSIVDHNDFSYLTATVLFQPFFEQPVPTGRISFGTVKARFGEAK
jgi:hypothetical protein